MIEEIQGLAPRHRAEPAYLERREVPTENLRLDHPQFAKHWLDRMERLDHSGLVGDTDYQ